MLLPPGHGLGLGPRIDRDGLKRPPHLIGPGGAILRLFLETTQDQLLEGSGHRNARP